MQERNIISGATATLISPLVHFYEALAPFLIAAIVLILTDSRFGIKAAEKRGEAIRSSRKWRRAINKLVDYICWATLAGMFGSMYGTVLGVPTLTALIMLVVYAIELSSVINNYLEYKGIHFKFNFIKFILAKIIGKDNVKEFIEKTDDDNKEA